MRQLPADPRDPQGSVCLPVGGGSVLKTPGPAHWWIKPGPGVNVRLLAGRASSWSLASGPRDLRAHFRFLQGDQLLALLNMGSGVF